MSIPKWKRWLSYLWEIHIETSFSEISGDLYVVMRKGRLQLCTSNAIYSYEDLYINFSKAFHKLQIDKTKDLEVLILGIGMGSVPIVMEHLGFEECLFTGVEIDEEIIELLSKYGSSKIQSPLTIVQADAVSFVQITPLHFDIIIIDVFINDVIPNSIQSIDFLQNVRSKLSKNGFVMMNHLSLTKKDRDKGKKYLDEIFKQVFSNGDYVDVSGNWMFISDSSRIES